MKKIALAALLAQAACTTPSPPKAPPPQAGPVAPGADPQQVYAGFLQSQAPEAKLRHQVETRFLGRTEVVEGFLLLALPDRFWVRGLTGFGTTLFDIKQRGHELSHEVHIEGAMPDSAPRFLARDIARLYLRQCAPDAPARREGARVLVSCALPPGEASIPWPGGVDEPDDHLEMELNLGGLLVAKRFSRGGRVTAEVTYSDHEVIHDRWWARRIELEHRQSDYGLRITLLDADPSFAASRALD